jgi:type I restriction enzyme R subunit
MPTPEEHAREQIDAMLVTSGWVVQDFTALNLGIGQGIALCEVLLESGRCDYLLFVNRKPLGVIEAKKAGTTLSTEPLPSVAEHF